jgi:hypothetical protein
LKEGPCKEKVAECSWKNPGGEVAPECIVKPAEKTSSDPRVCDKIKGNDALGAKPTVTPANGSGTTAVEAARK